MRGSLHLRCWQEKESKKTEPNKFTLSALVWLSLPVRGYCRCTSSQYSRKCRLYTLQLYKRTMNIKQAQLNMSLCLNSFDIFSQELLPIPLLPSSPLSLSLPPACIRVPGITKKPHLHCYSWIITASVVLLSK